MNIKNHTLEVCEIFENKKLFVLKKHFRIISFYLMFFIHTKSSLRHKDISHKVSHRMGVLILRLTRDKNHQNQFPFSVVVYSVFF